MGEQDSEYEAFVAELSGKPTPAAGSTPAAASAPPPLDETLVHVGALPPDFTEVALSAMFSTYGKIVFHKVATTQRRARVHGPIAARRLDGCALPQQYCADCARSDDQQVA
jgi:hypothetical protein